MTVFIRKMQDFSVIGFADPIDWEVPLFSSDGATGKFTFAEKDIFTTDRVRDWLQSGDRLWMISSVQPTDNGVTVTVTDAFGAFWRTHGWPADYAQYPTCEKMLANLFDQNYLNQWDEEYKMPYLIVPIIEENDDDQTPLILPEMKSGNFFAMADYLRMLTVRGVKTEFSVGSNSNLNISISKRPTTETKIFFGDGHNEYISSELAVRRVAKVTAVVNNHNYHYYLLEDGSYTMSNEPAGPPDRVSGDWQMIATTADRMENDVATAFAKSSDGTRIEFMSDRFYEPGELLRIWLGGEERKTEITSITISSKDNRFHYRAGERPGTITEKLRTVKNGSGISGGGGKVIETDPIFAASAAHGITNSDITNWNNKSNFSGSYNDLTNKPTIPTVGAGTVTVNQGGVQKGQFNVNQSGDYTLNLDAGIDGAVRYDTAQALNDTQKTQARANISVRTQTFYGTCSSLGDNPNKDVTITYPIHEDQFLQVKVGTRLSVKFDNGNEIEPCYLDLDAEHFRVSQILPKIDDAAITWADGETVDFVYDGDKWVMLGWIAQETDPTVPAWAKVPTPPTASDISCERSLIEGGDTNVQDAIDDIYVKLGETGDNNFLVTISPIGGSGWESDKTWEEIDSAQYYGKTVIAKFTDVALPDAVIYMQYRGEDTNSNHVFYGEIGNSAITAKIDIADNVLVTKSTIGNYYVKPTSGIPESDLSQDVQEKIDNALSASDQTPKTSEMNAAVGVDINGKLWATKPDADSVPYQNRGWHTGYVGGALDSLHSSQSRNTDRIVNLENTDRSLDDRITILELGALPETIYVWFASIVGGGGIRSDNSTTTPYYTAQEFIELMQSGKKIIPVYIDGDSYSIGYSNGRYKIDNGTAYFAFDVEGSFSGNNRTIILSRSPSATGWAYSDNAHLDLPDYSPLSDGSPPGYVRYDEVQALTEAEKAQARANIGVGSGGDIQETDPVFTASPAYGITAEDIQAWDAKYSKLVTGIPESDLASALQTKIGNAVQKDAQTPKTSAMTQAVGVDNDGKLWTVPGGGGGGGTTDHNDLVNRDISDQHPISAITNLESTLNNKLDNSSIADWAKQSSKPTYTKSEIGLGNVANERQYSANNPPPVDSSLSSTSQNPVQNKVINTAISGKYSKPSTGIPESDLASALQTKIGNAVQKDGSVAMVGDLTVGSAVVRTNGYLEGTWLRTTAATSLAANEIAVLNSGWIYKRAKTDFINDLGLITKDAQTAKTTAMTQAVGVDSNGKLWTVPGGGGEASVSAGVYYGTCSTEASTQTKVATLKDSTDFSLVEGVNVRIKFTNAQSYNGQPTLNVNGTGAKGIVSRGTTAGNRYMWLSGEIIDFVYDGTNWCAVDSGIASTTYYGVTKLSSSVSSTSTSTAATPAAVKAVNDRITYGTAPMVDGFSPLDEGVFYAQYS